MDQFPFDMESFAATIARMFVGDSSKNEIAILATGETKITNPEYNDWNGGTHNYTLNIAIPVWLYNRYDSELISKYQEEILQKCELLLKPYDAFNIHRIVISPQVITKSNWRENAKTWIAGLNISNQGRVRSDNLAPYTCDGLLFRSQPEINLYKALKSLGVTFAPLPVFIRGGDDYQRIEPDFVILQDGILLVVEVDGDTTHQETPVEAHHRTTILDYEGAFIERVKANECLTVELAQKCASKILAIIEKRKAMR